MRVWFALLVSPLLALADQSIALSMTGWSCANQQVALMHGTHFAFLAAAAVATVLAWRGWRDAARSSGADETLARRRFLAGLATATGALSILLIAAIWAPDWVLSPCFA